MKVFQRVKNITSPLHDTSATPEFIRTTKFNSYLWQLKYFMQHLTIHIHPWFVREQTSAEHKNVQGHLPVLQDTI